MTEKKIILIIKELGRVKSRLNTLKHDHRDHELVDKIAATIAKHQSFKSE